MYVQRVISYLPMIIVSGSLMFRLQIYIQNEEYSGRKFQRSPCEAVAGVAHDQVLSGIVKCLSEVIHQILSMCSVKAVHIMVPTVSLRWQASAAVLQLCQETYI